METTLKKTTADDSLILYAELNKAEVRAAQRRLKAGTLQRIAPGVLTACAEEEWPANVSAQFLFSLSSANLLENLTTSRGTIKKAIGKVAVEERLVSICESRGPDALNHIREEARELAGALGFEREFNVLNELIGSILGTRSAQLATAAGKAWAAAMPFDAGRLALFETLAAALREIPMHQKASKTLTERARINFAFLESYFSNFIEGTEFDVFEARKNCSGGNAKRSTPQGISRYSGGLPSSHQSWMVKPNVSIR